jgi:hypothetical protein
MKTYFGVTVYVHSYSFFNTKSKLDENTTLYTSCSLIEVENPMVIISVSNVSKLRRS